MKYWKILFILLGAAGGYAYYALIGCRTGACPLQSNPLFSTVWGGLLGFLLADAAEDVYKKIKSKQPN